MSNGIYVEVAIADTRTCQVAPQSTREGQRVASVTKGIDTARSGEVHEELTVVTDGPTTETDGGETMVGPDVETLFDGGHTEVRRFERQAPQHCVCERIESYGCPVRDVEAVDGTLSTTFVASDHDTLQSVLEELATVYDGMSVRRLLQSDEKPGAERRTLFDAGALTERQREVLSTAHRMGYFEHPKAASAREVAHELGIVASTFSENLAAAQRNLLDEFLPDER